MRLEWVSVIELVRDSLEDQIYLGTTKTICIENISMKAKVLWKVTESDELNEQSVVCGCFFIPTPLPTRNRLSIVG